MKLLPSTAKHMYRSTTTCTDTEREANRRTKRWARDETPRQRAALHQTLENMKGSNPAFVKFHLRFPLAFLALSKSVSPIVVVAFGILLFVDRGMMVGYLITRQLLYCSLWGTRCNHIRPISQIESHKPKVAYDGENQIRPDQT